MDIRFLAIDGFNLVRRIFEARQADSHDDLPQVTEAVIASCQRALEQQQPTHAAMVFELHDRTWRHLLDPGYKSGRKPPPTLLLDHIPVLEARLQRDLGLTCCAVPSYEADDVIATIAAVVSSHGGQVVILSTDRSYLQLLGPRIMVRDHFKGRNWHSADVQDAFGVDVPNLVDYFAMVGDKSNDVGGVPGIGPKSAVELLSGLGSLDHILALDCEDETTGADLEKSTVRKALKVQQHADEALRARQLVTLKTDVELGRNLKSFRIGSAS